MTLACINCFMVPVELAIIEEVEYALWYQACNVLIDIVFIMDLIVICNTSYEDGYETINNRKKIFAHYLRTNFTVDFVSAFPVDAVASLILAADADQFKIFSLLKLIRMLRLSRVIRALNVKRAIKTRLKLVKVFLQLILYLHC